MKNSQNKTSDEDTYKELNILFSQLTTKNLNDKSTKELIKSIDYLKRKHFYEKLLFRLGVILLILGIITLFWDKLRIYAIFLNRFIVVLVSV